MSVAQGTVAPLPGVGLLAPGPAGPRGGTRVLLLAGEGARIARSLARWSAQRPGDERWALIRAGGDEPAGLPPPGLEVVDFAGGGCACCVAASAFSLTLARILRRGPFERLFITLAASADPGKVADSLWSGPLSARLAAVEIVGVLAPDAVQRLMAALARAGLAAADVLLLGSPSDPDVPRLLRASLNRADAGADPDISVEPLAGLDWPELRSRLSAVREPSRWRWLADPVAPEPEGACQRWVWPASAVFDRRLAEAALRALAAQPALAELRAVLRTRREWYAWRAGSAEPRWASTASRRESRIECRTRPGVPIDLAAVAGAWDAALAANLRAG